MATKMIVQFSAPEGYGKTKLEVAFAKFCALHGVEAILPPDPQRAEFEAMSIEQLMAEVAAKGASVMIMESNAVPRAR
jgi:hypothetical protein